MVVVVVNLVWLYLQKYEEDLVALEKQRGVDMKYIHPQVITSLMIE